MIYYCFLIRRQQDKQAWPVIYAQRALAEDSVFRVSPITEIYLDEQCKCVPPPPRRDHYNPECPLSDQPISDRGLPEAPV
jgi:hypothetical protein